MRKASKIGKYGHGRAPPVVRSRASPMLRHCSHSGSLLIGRRVESRLWKRAWPSFRQWKLWKLPGEVMVRSSPCVWNTSDARQFHQQRKVGPAFCRGRLTRGVPQGPRPSIENTTLATVVAPVTSHRIAPIIVPASTVVHAHGLCYANEAMVTPARFNR